MNLLFLKLYTAKISKSVITEKRDGGMKFPDSPYFILGDVSKKYFLCITKLQRMEIIINPKYAHLEKFINGIPERNYTSDTVYCHRRNVVEKVTVDGVAMIIKKFKRPTWANMVIYTLFRGDKAMRAFRYSMKLEELGFETAEPIAAISIRKCGLLHTSYYIYKYMPYDQLVKTAELPFEQKAEIVRQFAHYTYKLHQAGLIHHDYSFTNVLYYSSGRDKYNFALIDINRMSFKGRPLTMPESLGDLRRLSIPFGMEIFYNEYCGLRGWDPEASFVRVVLSRRFKRFLPSIKHKVRAAIRDRKAEKENK